MQEKKQRVLTFFLEVISLAVLLPIFYFGTFKFLLVQLSDLTYCPNPKISVSTVFIIVLCFDAIWLLLMKLCFRNKLNIKLIITLFVLAFSAVILTGFVITAVLDEAFF